MTDGNHPAQVAGGQAQAGGVTEPPGLSRTLRSSRRFVYRECERDPLIKAWIIGGMIVATTCGLIIQRLEFDLTQLIKPLGFTSVLFVFYCYYKRRHVQQFTMCTLGLLHLVLFSSCYTILMYLAAMSGRPLIDAQLVDLDAAVGVHVPTIVAWIDAHAFVGHAFQLVYDSLLPQTALTVAVLGFLGEKKSLETFVLRFMISALLTLLLFSYLPADGPFRPYGYEQSASQQRYLAQFEALRCGALRRIGWDNAEGLITFPSFHATWALLLALAYRKRRVLFVTAAVLNATVIFSTLTTGWHYVSDVFAGVIVAMIALVLTRAARHWLYPEPSGCSTG